MFACSRSTLHSGKGPPPKKKKKDEESNPFYAPEMHALLENCLEFVIFYDWSLVDVDFCRYEVWFLRRWNYAPSSGAAIVHHLCSKIYLNLEMKNKLKFAQFKGKSYFE